MAAVNGSPKTVRISTSSEDTNGPDTKLNDDSEARESSNRREDRENQKAESKRRRLKLLRIQSLYFVITFLLILSPTSLLRFLIAAGFGDNVPPYKEYMEIPYNNYWLMVLQAFVFPLQSCANMLIYLSPKYATIRRHYSQETRWWAIRRTIFGASIRPSGGEDVSGNRPVGISISDFKSSRVSNTDNRMKQGRASIALAGDFFA
ncbi:unnamed protein product [Cylindrotheca closterium]|uniref:Uncharacterized protein n=1 Tax=Cylindrotheca closterium TaxID=2856 RepID=A0AAD2CRY4_9STRA|nr:unnamed protein product [Cylindrotheca closterium]